MIILIIGLIIFLIILFKLAKSLDKHTFSIKEKVLVYLFNAIINLEKYLKDKNSGNLKNTHNFINNAVDACFQIPSITYGTEWEKLTHSFFRETKIYFEGKVLKNMEMDSTDVNLKKVLSDLKRIFNALYKDNYQYVSILIKLNKEDKESFFEKYGVNKELIVNLFLSIIMMVGSFLGYWGLTKAMDSLSFNFGTAVLVALGVPGGLYMGLQFIEKVRKK